MSRNIGIIIIHGTMGSVLKKDGKKVWPVNLGSKQHYVDNLTPVSNSIEPSHMLFTYNRLLKKLKTEYSIVEEFIYDWRQNNLAHSSLLKSKISSMNVDEVHIVAHSMGGIIAKICLNEHIEDDAIKKVKKLITLGTPWKGSMDSVKTLLYGSRVPEKYLKFIEKDASKEISNFFPSVYQLLPTSQFLQELKIQNCIPYYLNNCYYDNFDDFFQGVLQENFNANHGYINVFNDYYELLNKDLSPDIEIHEIIGTGKPTIKMICENTRKEPYVNYDEGDGTVPIISSYSKLHNHGNYNVYFVNRASHTGLPSNKNVIKLVSNIIDEKAFTPSEEIFNDLNSPYYKKFSGYISKVACPVEISIRDKDGNIIYGNIETINEEEIREIFQTKYEIENVGDTTYVIFDENDETNINNFNGLTIDAYAKGLTSVSLEKYEEGKITERKAFKTFEIDTTLQAELILNDNTDQSSLLLIKDGQVEQTMKLEDVLVDEAQVTPPTTQVSFSGENILKLEDENIYFGKDIITFHIDDIIQGTFNPKQSFIVINGKEFVVTDNAFDLNIDNLEHGENTIEYFTIDEYDYSEPKEKVTFYYFHQVTSKLDFLFNDKLYIVGLREDSKYSQAANKYHLSRVSPEYYFEPEEGVTRNQSFYHDIDRKIVIKYKDIFQNEVSYNFLIDEVIARKLIKGAATVSDVEEFINKLELSNVSFQFNIKKSGNYKVLNDNNLNASHTIHIFSDEADIKVAKNVELDVSFETLSEHISISSNSESYSFIFKVLDIDQEYVSNLNLAGELSISLVPGAGQENKILKESSDVEYLPSSGSYKLILDIQNIREMLKDYWKPEEKVLGTAKLEIRNLKNNSVIRGLDIKIAK